MDAGFEAVANKVIEKKYAEAATAMYEDLVILSGKGIAEQRVSMVDEIKAKLESLHREQLAGGLFSDSQKAMAVEASAQAVIWLRDKLGLDEETDTLVWRLGV